MDLPHDIWVGSYYSSTTPRVLILGESVYGSGEPLRPYLERWIQGKLRDHTFGRIFNAFSASHTSRAAITERRGFWDRVIFYNFVVGTVGPTRKHRPTETAYKASRESLEGVLSEYKPMGVVILGKEQSQYSRKIIEGSGVRYKILPHPAAWGIRTELLTRGWKELHRELACS